MFQSPPNESAATTIVIKSLLSFKKFLIITFFFKFKFGFPKIFMELFVVIVLIPILLRIFLPKLTLGFLSDLIQQDL